MSRRLPAASTFLILLSAAIAAQSETMRAGPAPFVLGDGPLTLSRLEQLALVNNPSLAEARANVDAVRGRWLQVGLPPNTMIGYSGQQLGSGGLAEQHGVYLGQEIVRGGKLRLNRAIVDHEVLKAEQLWAAQEQRVLTDVRLGYYEVLISQRRNEVTQRLVDIAGDAVRTAKSLLTIGDVSDVDVIRAHGTLQMAQLLNRNARTQYVAAWSRLGSVLGTPQIPPQPLVGQLDGVAFQIDEQVTRQQLLSASPELAAAHADLRRAQQAVQRARAEPIPDLEVQGILQSDNGTGSSNAALQVALPLPWLNRNQGGIRQAEAELVSATHAVARVELSLQRRLATVFQQYQIAHNQVADYSQPDGILDNAQAALDIIGQRYELGEVAYLELLTAQTSYSQTSLAYLEALGELWAAKLEIDGLLLKDSLEADPRN